MFWLTTPLPSSISVTTVVSVSVGGVSQKNFNILIILIFDAFSRNCPLASLLPNRGRVAPIFHFCPHPILRHLFLYYLKEGSHKGNFENAFTFSKFFRSPATIINTFTVINTLLLIEVNFIFKFIILKQNREWAAMIKILTKNCCQ